MNLHEFIDSMFDTTSHECSSNCMPCVNSHSSMPRRICQVACMHDMNNGVGRDVSLISIPQYGYGLLWSEVRPGDSACMHVIYKWPHKLMQ